VSLPPSPAGKHRSWADTLRLLGGSIAVQVWSAMSPGRWILATAVFAVTAYFVEGQIVFGDPDNRRRIDAWDLFPGLLIDFALLFVVWGFGFLLFVADSYSRGREQGTLSVALVRMPSRPLYWLGTMGAVGVVALMYVTLAFVVSLAVGMIAFPPATLWPMLPREGMLAMYPQWNMPLPVYHLILVGYTAWGLWVAGCVVVLLSLFVRHKVAVVSFVLAWNLVSMVTHNWLLHVNLLRIVNVGFLIGIFKHHMQKFYPAVPFFTLTAAALVLMAVVGSWKMRREEP
jgi:hypothetical protein